MDKRYKCKDTIINCLNCEIKYTLFVSKEAIEKGKYRKYCSRKCANKSKWDSGVMAINKVLSKCIDCLTEIVCNRRHIALRCVDCEKLARIERSRKHKEQSGR